MVLAGLLAGVTGRAKEPPAAPGTHLRVLETSAGFELRYTLSIPDGYSPKMPAPLVLSLHYGFDRSRPYPDHFGRGMLVSLVAPGLEKLKPVIVAPDSHGKRWSDDVIETSVVELMAKVQGDYAIDPRRIAVVGFSMGGRASWEYAARHPRLFTAIIPMASRVDLATAEAVEVPIFAIHSRADERVPIAPLQQVIEALKRKGRKVELLTLDGVRHYETPRYAGALARAVPWLKEVWD